MVLLPSIRPKGSLVVATLGIFSCVIACVVETEPTPKPPLLRDVMAARAAAAAKSAPASVAVVVATPAPSVAVTAPVATFDAPGVPDAFRICQTNAECVAVLPNGCCHDGRNVAMNKSSVEPYKKSFTCPDERPRCPMHMVLDRREPACDTATHMCKLVAAPDSP
jgi:hypothetical protein